jgi:hypothetical protein
MNLHSVHLRNGFAEKLVGMIRPANVTYPINPLNTELNPICHLLALLGAHHILHVSGIRIKLKRVDNSDHSPLFLDKTIFTSSAMAYSNVQGHRFVFTYCTYFTVCGSMSTYMKCVFVTLDFQ